MLYAVTLHGCKTPKQRSLTAAWYLPIVVGQPLPTIPVWLGPDQRIELPLEPSYQETCEVFGIARWAIKTEFVECPHYPPRVIEQD